MPDIYLNLDGQQAGPYSPAQVHQLLSENKISSTTPAWHQALTEWSTVAQVLAQFPGASSGPPPYVLPPPRPPVTPRKSSSKGMGPGTLAAAIVGGALVLLVPCCAGVALGPIMNGVHKAKEAGAIQQTRLIGLALFSYENDHNGAYPTGKTSTEVFQQLLDQKYVADPAMFYLEMPGKTKATSGHLTADNVCYDVTAGVDAAAFSDDAPLVFCTGYTVTYAARASATRDVPIATPFPGPGKGFAGVAVVYHSNSARFINADDDGSVPGFIGAAFSADGKTYQQLRP